MTLRLKFKNIIIKLLCKLSGKNPVYYINGPQTLPPPLSADEENELLESFEDKRDEVSEILIVHNLRLVVYIAKKFDAPGNNIEDLISIGTIGLIKAVKTFCPNKNIKLATYASRCIENEILMYLRKTAQQKTEISIDEPLNVDWDGNELLLSDVLGSDSDIVGSKAEAEDEKNMLERLVNNLPVRERQIMNMRFGMQGFKEYTQKEVADYLGISQSYISRLENRIIKKLKKEIEKCEIY